MCSRRSCLKVTQIANAKTGTRDLNCDQPALPEEDVFRKRLTMIWRCAMVTFSGRLVETATHLLEFQDVGVGS